MPSFKPAEPVEALGDASNEFAILRGRILVQGETVNAFPGIDCPESEKIEFSSEDDEKRKMEGIGKKDPKPLEPQRSDSSIYSSAVPDYRSK
ncbi:hypothetical protein H920_13982 [Fukomys damarensis]|uniref:Uncharacterized protein n=1 Tax=Fukomys damarensis TaxID=885580 RepID=A0A091D114_FUKDA|nr:hypothetical protein H920_13982 [Fukomys damarensis]